jgi:putative peptidoglycan lipid II flippase
MIQQQSHKPTVPFPQEPKKAATTMHSRTIMLKTLQVGASTIVSRMMGLVRDMLLVRYMGTGVIQDAFRIAFKLPNMLRQIFAEGALSPVVVPTIVKLVKEGDRTAVNRFMTLSFVLFEGAVLAIAALMIWQAPAVITMTAPGFGEYQTLLAARMLRILASYIFFISSNSLLAGALQAANHFWVPALAPIINNVCFIGGLLICLLLGLPVEYFCLFVLLSGVVQFMMHLGMYFRLGYAFDSIKTQTLSPFKSLMHKFIPAMLSGGMMQWSQVVDNFFASYLPAGSISLLDLSNGFLRIPLGVVVALSTILLPHFSRVVTYAPKRLSYYLLEGAKLVFWVTLPATLVMSFLSEKIFYTLFYSKSFSLAHVAQAKFILCACLLSLFFHAINKVLLSMFYSLHQVWLPAAVTMSAMLMNIVLCQWWVSSFQVTGLAIATSVSAAFQTTFFILLLRYKFKFRLYPAAFAGFFYRYVAQLAVVLGGAYAVYNLLLGAISFLPATFSHALTATVFFWVWTLPLICVTGYMLYMTREIFGVHLHFLRTKKS